MQTLQKLLRKDLTHQTMKLIDRYQLVKTKTDWIN